MTTIVFNKLATIVKLQPKHKLPFNRVESLPSILRSDPLTTCIDNDVLGKVNAGEGLTVHRRLGIVHPDGLPERLFVPVEQGVSRVALA